MAAVLADYCSMQAGDNVYFYLIDVFMELENWSMWE